MDGSAFTVALSLSQDSLIFETNVGLTFALVEPLRRSAPVSRFLLLSPCCRARITHNEKDELVCQECLHTNFYTSSTTLFYRTPEASHEAIGYVEEWGIKSKSFVKHSLVKVLEDWLAPYGDTFEQLLWARELEAYLKVIYEELADVGRNTEALYSWVSAQKIEKFSSL